MVTSMFVRKVPVLTLMVLLCVHVQGKASEEKSNTSAEVKSTSKSDVPGLLFADELKQIIERYMFGVCPQPYKVVGGKKNGTAAAAGCDLDADQHDLAGRLATLALRAHAASRADCTRFGSALANTLGELARGASNRQVLAAAAASDNKKRKLSKSQKKQIQAKQRTALAVKKKAAAVAARLAASAP